MGSGLAPLLSATDGFWPSAALGPSSAIDPHVLAAGSVRVPGHATNSLRSFALRTEDRSTEHCGSEFARSARRVCSTTGLCQSSC